MDPARRAIFFARLRCCLLHISMCYLIMVFYDARAKRKQRFFVVIYACSFFISYAANPSASEDEYNHVTSNSFLSFSGISESYHNRIRISQIIFQQTQPLRIDSRPDAVIGAQR